MNVQQQGILLLMRNAILGESTPLPEGFQLSEAVSTVRKHRLFSMIYYGALQSGLPKDQTMEGLFQRACLSLAAGERQLWEIDRIFSAFDRHGISYLPLKGAVLKGMYPKQEMRPMSDADILIRTEEYEKIKPLLTDLGFEEQAVSDHELIWHSPSLHLELHKRLIPSYNKDYYAYFGDGWNLAQPCREQKNRYEMSPENTFLFLFTHMAKHYRDGGIGLTQMTDLWLYRKHHPELKMEVLETALKQLRLWEFYQNIQETLEVWFGTGTATEKTDFITHIIFESGAYGTHASHMAASAVRLMDDTHSAADARNKKTLGILFPKCENMAVRYPVLKKAPVLLPLFWVLRAIETLLFSAKKIKKHAENTALISDETIIAYRNALNYVGLDFHFEE